ncbi:MAG TPA: long-chain-acyl-CoA synthetase [Caulobacteraceae bacterium]
MGLAARLRREARFAVGLLRTLARVATIRAGSKTLICDDLERAVDRWRDRAAISLDGEGFSYGELDAAANRYAHWARAQRLARGEIVAVVLANRLDYLAIWYGLAKVGVVAALINDELVGATLAHCLEASRAAHCILDARTRPRFDAVRPSLASPMVRWMLEAADGGEEDLAAALSRLSPSRPPRSLRAGMTARDTALLIFTSGTTGLPKAARVTHLRAQLYMRGFAGATGARPDDRLYLALPLYHATGGLCAMGAALLNGASVALRRDFSAHRFWADVTAERATLFVYIGELCRYLVNQRPGPAEAAHSLRLAFGNGLAPDVWTALERRFRIPRILEFYGSTEGNVSMFNFDGTPGAIGRAPRFLRALFNVALVRFDLDREAPLRIANGLCMRPALGETGECVGKIGAGARSAYAGYVDAKASEAKVLRDVFRRGDRWFRTGDLMRQDAEGYFYFVDRIGDTFRWKGQNVSTTEVSQVLLEAPGVLEATVYGVAVAGHDGRAGMAALVVGPEFDLRNLASRIDTVLPSYAQPVFLRLMPRINTTGTFKHRKAELVAAGFDPAKVAPPLYFRDAAAGYVALTPALHASILAPGARI